MTSTYPITKDQDWISPATSNLFKRFNYEGCGIDWASIRVLDVGCNVGNYVNWSSNIVSRENYVGLDINEKFINIANIIHPEYQFVHCNKWHRSYNPLGIKNLSIRNSLTGEFDVAISNSVLSHASADEIRAEILDIFTILKPGGILLTTFFTDINLMPFLNYLKYTNGIDTRYSIPNYETFVYLINCETLVADQDTLDLETCNTFFSFYKEEKLAELFTGAEVVSTAQPSLQALVKFTKPL